MKIMCLKIFVLFVINFVIFSKFASCELIKPKPYSSETRFKACTYDPKGVYYITLHAGHPMYIEFDAEEKIDTMYTPNKKDFEIAQVGNKLFLKALSLSSETTLTVMTNQRNYFFELHVKEPSGPFDKDITFFVKFRYPAKVKSAGQNIEGDNSILQFTKTEIPDFKR